MAQRASWAHPFPAQSPNYAQATPITQSAAQQTPLLRGSKNMTSRFAIPTFSPRSRDDSTDLHKSWSFSDEDTGRLKRRVAVWTKRFLHEVRTFVSLFVFLIVSWEDHFGYFSIYCYTLNPPRSFFQTVVSFSMLGYMDLLKVFTWWINYANFCGCVWRLNSHQSRTPCDKLD